MLSLPVKILSKTVGLVTLFLIVFFGIVLLSSINYVKNGTELCLNSTEKEKLTNRNSVTDRSFYSNKYANGTIKPPAVYLTFKGGLGNQLFQYACSYTLARRINFPLYVDLPPILVSPDRKFGPGHRNFGLDFFNVPLTYFNIVNETLIPIYNRVELKDFDLLVEPYPKDSILHHSTHCLSEVFFAPFKEEIIQMFELKSERLVSPAVNKWEALIGFSEESVAVHIRTGDFDWINRVPISFQKSAMRNITQMLKSRPRFFIFSDDINDVEKQFKLDKNFTELNYEIYFVSNPDATTSLQEFYLMSKCRHQIIPNSSFSWWAAYLNKNPNKIVIAAHHNAKAFEPSVPTAFSSFLIWELKYLYYPENWIVYDPFK